MSRRTDRPQRPWYAALFSLVLALPASCLEGDLSMHGLTNNVAETAPDHEDPELRPRVYDKSVAEILTAAEAAIQAGTRWELVASDPETGTLTATHTTRLFKWVDDVTVTITQQDDGKVVVNVRSASRVGKGDLGQNAFNVREFYRLLDEQLATTP